MKIPKKTIMEKVKHFLHDCFLSKLFIELFLCLPLSHLSLYRGDLSSHTITYFT